MQVSTGLQRTPLHLSILHTLVELRFLCENVISLVTRLAVRKRTSSFPVAERPRDASCLSAISFSSRISRAHCSIISYYYGFRFTIAYKCRSVVFGVTLKFLVINTSSLELDLCPFKDKMSWSLRDGQTNACARKTVPAPVVTGSG